MFSYLKTRIYVICVILLFASLGLNSVSAIADDGDCCVDLEERIAELEATVVSKKEHELEITIGGQVSRVIYVWDDGVQTGVYSLDNSVDETELEIVGEAELEGGWKVEFEFGLDFIQRGATDTSDQISPNRLVDALFAPETSDAFFAIENERLGKLTIGRSDTFADGVESQNLADASPLVGSDINDWNDAFYLRAAGFSGIGGLTTGFTAVGDADLRWGDFEVGAFTGDTIPNINYASPQIGGFTVGGSWGNADEADFWDVGLYYDKIWSDRLRVVAAVGYSEAQNSLSDFVDVGELRDEPIDGRAWGGSIALKHIPTGLNIAFNYGDRDLTDGCAEPGVISGKCWENSEFYYVVGGLVRKFFDRGRTAFYIDYQKGTKILNDSDEDLLRTLEAVPDTAAELRESEVSAWGIGVVQYLDAASMAVYLGYKHFEIDFDLVGNNGKVATKPFEDFDVIMGGGIIKF